MVSRSQHSLLERFLERLHPMFLKSRMDMMAEQPLLPPGALFPPATFARAREDKSGKRLPQAIAHRGYKAKYAENTMPAFAAAVEVGAHAIETDIHLSRDGVVVISHDPTLKRCFGKPEKIIDCDWEYLKTVRTLREPHAPMPRLLDVLEYLAKPECAALWLLLDIKMDNDADDVMRLIGDTIRQVPPCRGRPWNERVILGIWARKYLPLCYKYIPNFPITHISFSISYARQFLAVPGVSFNMLQMVLMAPCGPSFLKEARKAGRPVLTWTVNEDQRMRWCIRKKLDGCITDDPKRFLEICEEYDEDADEREGIWPWAMIWVTIKINVLAFIFSCVLQMKYGRVNKRVVKL